MLKQLYISKFNAEFFKLINDAKSYLTKQETIVEQLYASDKALKGTLKCARDQLNQVKSTINNHIADLDHIKRSRNYE